MQDGGKKKRASALAISFPNWYTERKRGVSRLKVLLCDCIGLTEGDLSAFFGALPPGRRAYAARYKKTVDRATAAVGFLLVSRLIREVDPTLAGIDWEIGERGKPYLPGNPYHFSLSHSDGLCAAVVSSDPIGLDVERIRPLRPALLPRFCTPEEIALCANDPDSAVKIWTRREARAKENGRGIGQKLASLSDAGVTSLRHSIGGRDFWLSYTAGEPAEIVAVKPEELLG